jgi:integrase
MRSQTNGDHRKMVRTSVPGVFKRGSRYVAVFRLPNGKQRRESARTLADARRLKAARQTEIARGEFHDASRITFWAYFLEWVERYQGRGKSGFRESTREEYRRLGESYACPYFGKRRKLSEIGPADIAKFIRWLCDEEGRRKRLSDSTIRNILNPVRSCMATALHEGLIRSNPAAGAALPHRPKPEDDREEELRPLGRTELATFLSLLPSRYRLFFRLLASTGLRISEAVALRWRDARLDGSQPELKVRRAYVKGRMGLPKTRYSRREVPLDHELVTELRAHRARSKWPEDDDLIFPSSVGRPMDQGNLRSRVLRPIAEEAGVPWIGFHTFRRTCASLLFQRGANLVQVQRWLGHHSAAFTLATYVDLLPGELGVGLSLSEELAGPSSERLQQVALPPELPPGLNGNGTDPLGTLETAS